MEGFEKTVVCRELEKVTLSEMAANVETIFFGAEMHGFVTRCKVACREVSSVLVMEFRNENRPVC